MTQKIGLALGSGAARGLAHVGVLEVLEEEGIRVDMIAGTSAGALIGALYAQGRSARQVKDIVASLGWQRLIPLVDVTLPRSGLIGGRRITAWLRQVIGRDIRFSDLKLPFACVATDIMTGEEVVMNEGSVLEAVRASFSIPGVFALVRRGSRYLVDGSLSNAVPVSIVRDMGAEFTIAVNVLPNVVPQEQASLASWRSRGRSREPGMVEVLVRSLYIGVHRLAESDVKGADIVIEPKTAHIGPGDFHHAREAILQGELAAQDAIPKLKALLGASQ